MRITDAAHRAIRLAGRADYGKTGTLLLVKAPCGGESGAVGSGRCLRKHRHISSLAGLAVDEILLQDRQEVVDQPVDYQA